MILQIYHKILTFTNFNCVDEKMSFVVEMINLPGLIKYKEGIRKSRGLARKIYQSKREGVGSEFTFRVGSGSA